MEQLELTFTKRRGRQRIPLEQRFWMKVDQNGPIPPHVPELGNCWVWTASRHQGGYGQIMGRKRGLVPVAHRVSWELHNGTIPDGLLVCHRCDNRACVRPDHLFLGTTQDNVRDMVMKGRNNPPRGERAARAKLTERDVIDIRRQYATGGVTQEHLAKRFNVDQAAVSHIVRRVSWKHVA